MFYYNVIPLEKIQTDKFPTFTYCYPENIPTLSLVQIPLLKRIVPGIIWQKTAKPIFPVKSIQKILEKSFLTQKQCLLAQKISDYYFFPFNQALKLFFHSQNGRKKKEKEENIFLGKKNLSEKKLIPTLDQKKAIKKIFQKTHSKFLIFGPASSGKTLIAWKIAQKIIREKKQVLLVLPEIFLAYQEKERWQKNLNLSEEEIFFAHSREKKTLFQKKWEETKQGKIKLIIGTRSVIFLPFSNLGLIVVDEQQDYSHRQWEKSPFYDARKLAEFLTQIFSAKLLFLSSTPTPEIFFDKKIKKIILPRLKTKKWQILPPKIILADLRKNFFSRQHFLLTKELKKEIEKIFQEKKMAFLLAPQQGFGRRIFCTDCRKNIKCPHCQINLTDTGEYYRCLRCGYKISSLTVCPYCHSFRLKSLGIGTEKIAQEIKTFFPKKKIFIADKKFFQKETTKKETWEKLKKQQVDILIGTQTIAKGFDFPFLQLAAVLEAESFIGENNFRFDEKRIGTFFQLAGRVNRPQSDQQGIFVIQTFQPETSDWKILENMDWIDWLEKEKINRQSALYPPFCFLSKLVFIHEKKELVEKKIKEMYTILSHKKFKKFFLSLNFPATQPQFFRKKWRWFLLLKTAKPLCQILFLRKFFSKKIMKGNWKIEIDPESIF